MTHTPHEIAADFPEFQDTLHELRLTDAHFAKLTDDYHQVNKSIHLAETDVAPTDDLHLVSLRKSRMALKDQIYAAMRAAS